MLVHFRSDGSPTVILPEVLPAGRYMFTYEAAATTIALVLTENHLESLARGYANSAIRGPLGLQAYTARIVPDGQEMAIPTDGPAVPISPKPGCLPGRAVQRL